MIVKEIMKKSIITIGGNDTILDACNKYRDNKTGCLIVIDEEQVIGLVTERDLIERTICMGRDPEKTKIKEIMTHDVITIDPFDRIDKALEIIKKNKIKKLPVVSNDKLVGIVTITDIAYTKSVIKEFLELHRS
jgi:CBS domain-containing protein